MKNIFALTITLASIFALNVANAAQPSHVKAVKTESHTKSVKKMKDTPDQLMSTKQVATNNSTVNA